MRSKLFFIQEKHLTVIAAFILMLCLGGVYAWSIIASELIEKHNFSAAQSQVIFGLVIATFPVTMIFVGQLAKNIKVRYLGYISGVLFFLGYFLASLSDGNYFLILFGIGILAGISTGFGYWISLTVPVQWFPQKKGLITGIVAAGFGLGAVILSELSEIILSEGKDVFQLLLFIGILYGAVIILFSNLISQKNSPNGSLIIKKTDYLHTGLFKKLISGIFLGTFAGLLIIGSLKIIGGQSNISNHILIVGVSLFAVANFLGRLFWGLLSDRIGASLNIFFALLFQSVAIILIELIPLSNNTYLVLSFLIGFGFGGNFVLFAKETAHAFGLDNLGIVYPYVFLGYAIAGIAGPLSGGVLFDVSGNFTFAIVLASIMSLGGSLLFFHHHIKTKNM